MKRGDPWHLFAWTMGRNRFRFPNHSVGLGMGKVKGWKSEFRGADNRFSTVGKNLWMRHYPNTTEAGAAVQSQLGLHIKFQASRSYIETLSPLPPIQKTHHLSSWHSPSSSEVTGLFESNCVHIVLGGWKQV